jgi:hypothetical protein
VTRLDTFARVIRHSGEFGASGHCLIFTHDVLKVLNISYILLIWYVVRFDISSIDISFKVLSIKSETQFKLQMSTIVSLKVLLPFKKNSI